MRSSLDPEQATVHIAYLRKTDDWQIVKVLKAARGLRIQSDDGNEADALVPKAIRGGRASVGMRICPTSFDANAAGQQLI